MDQRGVKRGCMCALHSHYGQPIVVRLFAMDSDGRAFHMLGQIGPAVYLHDCVALSIYVRETFRCCIFPTLVVCLAASTSAAVHTS